MFYIWLVHCKLHLKTLTNEELKYVLEIGENRLVRPFFNFLNNPYWSRAWIIEEIALARKAVIYYGWTSLSFDMVYGLGEKLRGGNFGSCLVQREVQYIELPLPYSAWARLNVVCVVRDTITTNNPMPILDLLALCRESGVKATEARDRVFAMLGISEAAHHETLQPDASKPAIQVYRELAEYCLALKDPLEVLHYAGFNSENPSVGLPSWTPDWQAPMGQRILWRRDESFQYHASDNMTPFVIRIPDSLLLKLRGRNLDRISYVSRTLLDPCTPSTMYESFSYLSQQNTILRETWEAASQRWPEFYFGAERTYNAYWRTLIGNRVKATHSLPAPEKYAEYYAACRRYLNILSEFPLNITGKALAQAYPETAALALRDLQLNESDVNLREQALLSNKHLVQAFEKDERKWGVFLNAMGGCSRSRRFALTDLGYMAMVPIESRVGDSVCIIDGAQTPFLLREKSERLKSYHLIGECYVHGWMDGEMSNKGEVEYFHLA